MNNFSVYCRFIFCFLIAVIIAGCAAVRQQMVCPGAQSVEQGLSAASANWQNAVAIRATGRAVMQYDDNGPHKESFSVKLWANPPAEIYLQGDIAFDPKGIVFGTNEEGFWLILKPKEIRSYRYGRWSEQNGGLGENLLEVIAAADINNSEDWLLDKDGDFDILTKTDEQGRVLRRLYLDKCDSLIRKVREFDPVGGKLIGSIELDKYKQLTGDFRFPSFVRVASGDTNFVEIRLGSVKEAKLSEKQREIMFNRPGPEGFECIYKIVGGRQSEEQP